MDDSIKKNLIAQKETLKELNELYESLEKNNDFNQKDLSGLKIRSKRLREEIEKITGDVPTPNKTVSNTYDKIVDERRILTYEEVTKQNLDYLNSKGMLDKEFDSLFTKDELFRIEQELSSPIQREKWDKWDFVAVLSGGIAGVIADFLSDDVKNVMMNKLGESDTLRKWGNQTKGLSIDYQGRAFGGPLHEGLSSGHDILRPLKAIAQIKNGTFLGLKQVPGGFEWVKSSANQFGNPYDNYGWWESFILWVKHIASDAANPTGLPFPGMSFLMEMSNHDVRKFAILLYKNGYTLQHIIAQALSPALVELIVRGYIFGREFKETGDIKWPSAKKLKTTEMLLASHAMVTAINVGKVAVRCNAEGPLALRKLNIPSIIMTVRYFIPFVVKRMKLNDPVEILKRNAREIIEGYDSIILELSEKIKKDDDYRRFLENGEQIIV